MCFFFNLLIPQTSIKKDNYEVKLEITVHVKNASTQTLDGPGTPCTKECKYCHPPPRREILKAIFGDTWKLAGAEDGLDPVDNYYRDLKCLKENPIFE